MNYPKDATIGYLKGVLSTLGYSTSTCGACGWIELERNSRVGVSHSCVDRQITSLVATLVAARRPNQYVVVVGYTYTYLEPHLTHALAGIVVEYLDTGLMCKTALARLHHRKPHDSQPEVVLRIVLPEIQAPNDQDPVLGHQSLARKIAEIVICHAMPFSQIQNELEMIHSRITTIMAESEKGESEEEESEGEESGEE